MSATLVIFVIHLIGGAVGGFGVGTISKHVNLGMSGNIIVGTLGGGFGGWLLDNVISMPADAGDIGSIVEHLVGGGVTGAIVTAIVATFVAVL